MLQADSSAKLIRYLDLASGTVTTLAGTPHTSGDRDGLGNTATFSSVTSLAMDAAGTFAVVVRAEGP